MDEPLKVVLKYREIHSWLSFLLKGGREWSNTGLQDESLRESSTMGCFSIENMLPRDTTDSNMTCEYNWAQHLLPGNQEPVTPPQTLEFEKCNIYLAFPHHPLQGNES